MTHLLVDNPAPIFFGVFLLAIVLFNAFIKRAGSRLIEISALCGIISASAYLVINILSINRVGMLWHDEANILSISAAYTRGQQMYHPVSASALYSLFYGPSTFLVYAPFLAFFSHPILPIRLAIFTVNLLNLVLLFMLLRTRLSRPVSLAILPVGIAFLLAYPGVLLGNRGDAWLLLCILLAIVSVLRYRPFGWVYAALISGICSGLAINFKATVAPVVCLVIAVLYRKYGHRAVILSALSCLGSAVAVFCLPHIALLNYLAWLLISSHQRFLKSTCAGNILAGAFLLAPAVLIMVFGGQAQRSRRYGWVIPSCCGLAFIVCIVTGSKNGAGGWHLWPMVPFALLGAAYEISLRSEVCRRQPELSLERPERHKTFKSNKTLVVVASIALAGTSASMFFAVRDVRAVRPAGNDAWRTKELTAQQALDRIMQKYSSNHNLEMGPGVTVTDYRTDLRFELPLAGQEYFFDENGVVEGIKSNFSIPSNVTSRILGCGSIWIIPHGEAPFSSVRGGVLPITTTTFIFPDEIRLHFGDTHTVFERGNVYDLWKCSADAARPTSVP